MAKANEIFETVTQQLLTSMRQAQQDGIAWQAPWAKVAAMPTNASTGKAYTGGNAIVLWLTSECRTWATYKQWQAMGAQVRKGQRGVGLVKWSPVEDKKKPVGADGKRPTVLVPFGFVVFSADQVDGYDAPAAPDALSHDERVELADAFFAQTGADVRHQGDRAYYDKVADRVTMPAFELFYDGASYYSTLAHECCHWTGHQSRLDRDLSGRFGCESYAAEELVAEIGAAFVMASLGLASEPRADHAHYLASWIRSLENDPKAFFTAASKAQQAATFLADRAALVAA